MFGNAEAAKVGKQILLVAREGKGIHKNVKCISTKLGFAENTQKIFQPLAKYIFLYIFYFYNFNFDFLIYYIFSTFIPLFAYCSFPLGVNL